MCFHSVECIPQLSSDRTTEEAAIGTKHTYIQSHGSDIVILGSTLDTLSNLF